MSPFESMMNDKIIIHKPDGEKMELRCSFQEPKVTILGLHPNIEEDQTLDREISGSSIEYIITHVKLSDVGDISMNHTSLKVEKMRTYKKKQNIMQPSVSIGVVHADNFAVTNTGNQISENHISTIKQKISDSSNPNKEEILALIEKYEKSKDTKHLLLALSIAGDAVTLLGFLGQIFS